jgi:hypothetical protein
MYHLCGQGCAMKAMERFMTTGAIEPASALEDGFHAPALR